MGSRDGGRRIIGWCTILLLGLLCMSVTMALNPTTTPLPVNETFIVNDVGDEADADPADGVCATATGVCTLRAAIQQANAQADATDLLMDIISFNIPGDGPHLIQPASPLPPLVAPVFIDGTTQPGFDAATNTRSIELDGSRAGDEASGLMLIAGNSVIQGLAISNFEANGVFIDNSHNNTVGALAAGNIISGNAFDGILISGTSTMNQILDNTIDNNMNGVAVPDEGLANSIRDNAIFGNLLNGVLISGTSTMNEVFENSISDNLLNGVLVSGSSTANEILSNSIFSTTQK